MPHARNASLSPPMNARSTRRVLPHVLVVCALVGILVQGDRSVRQRDLPLRELSLPACRLDHVVCRAQPDPGVSIVLALAPRPVPAGTPFVASLQVEGVDALAVELEFEGVDMNMGLFRQTLDAQGKGRFESSVILPLCATGAMRWHARLLVRTADELLMLPFDLTTGA